MGADMETLERLLTNTVKEYIILRDTLQEVRADQDKRATRNKRLRDRLENMKSDMGARMSELFANMAGVDPRDVMSEAEIDQHLTDAFNKFDESGDGQLGQWEFQQAWFYLGLKGTEDEIKDTFGEVDTNSSGLIDLKEFITAIKGERMLELSLTRVLNKMGVQYSDAQSDF